MTNNAIENVCPFCQIPIIYVNNYSMECNKCPYGYYTTTHVHFFEQQEPYRYCYYHPSDRFMRIWTMKTNNKNITLPCSSVSVFASMINRLDNLLGLL